MMVFVAIGAGARWPEAPCALTIASIRQKCGGATSSKALGHVAWMAADRR